MQKCINAFDQMMMYAEQVNPESVDPQLKNNSELQRLLVQFEEQWTLGTEHLLNPKHRMHLAAFGGLIDNVAERHVIFKNQLEQFDNQIFLSIPALAILYNLKDIVHRFAPSLSITAIVEEINKNSSTDRIEEEVLQLGQQGTPRYRLA
jgi:hypothetical protein